MLGMVSDVNYSKYNLDINIFFLFRCKIFSAGKYYLTNIQKLLNFYNFS